MVTEIKPYNSKNIVSQSEAPTFRTKKIGSTHISGNNCSSSWMCNETSLLVLQSPNIPTEHQRGENKIRPSHPPCTGYSFSFNSCGLFGKQCCCGRSTSAEGALSAGDGIFTGEDLPPGPEASFNPAIATKRSATEINSTGITEKKSLPRPRARGCERMKQTTLLLLYFFDDTYVVNLFCVKEAYQHHQPWTQIRQTSDR